MLFKKVCPRCGRRYPKNFTDCLECGSRLIDTEKEARNGRLKKHLPLLGILLAGVIIIAVVLFGVIPLVQYSLSSGQEMGTLTTTNSQQTISTYTMNQPVSDGILVIRVDKIRDGAKSANSNKFLIISVTMQNLRADTDARVAATDFLLIDSSGINYPSYGVNDKVAQQITPGDTESYDLIFEVPQDAGGLRLQYFFASSGDRSSARPVHFLLV